MQEPKIVDEWKEIESKFSQHWNFPKCVEAIDGNHVIIKRPPCSGSTYFNSKKTYSIILFAMFDADYRFTYIDVGGNGRASDSAIFRYSTLNIAMESNTLGIPDHYVVIGDDAFPLRKNLLKPYSKTGLSDMEKVFNYRLSRAIRVVENAFSILAWKFRIFSRPIDLKPKTTDKVIWTVCYAVFIIGNERLFQEITYLHKQ